MTACSLHLTDGGPRFIALAGIAQGAVLKGAGQTDLLLLHSLVHRVASRGCENLKSSLGLVTLQQGESPVYFKLAKANCFLNKA